MSDVDDLAREVRRLKGELAALKQGLAETRGRQDVWAANGLEDLDAGHGNQRFGAGDYRLDQTGIQLVDKSGLTANIAAIRWVNNDFRTAVNKNTAPIAYLTGSNYNGVQVLLLQTQGASGADFAYQQVESGSNYALVQTIGQANSRQGYIQFELTDGVTRALILSDITLRLASRTSDFTGALAVTFVDGDLWYRSDTDKIRARINGATENLATESYVAANPAGAHPFLLMGA